MGKLFRNRVAECVKEGILPQKLASLVTHAGLHAIPKGYAARVEGDFGGDRLKK